MTDTFCEAGYAGHPCRKPWVVLVLGDLRLCHNHWLMLVDTMTDINDLPEVQLYDQDKEA